jgi:hypothetical protein
VPFYRYLAFDDAGPYALLSRHRLTRSNTGAVTLVLLETTENWLAALEAHRELEAALAADAKGALAKVAGQHLPEARPRRGRRKEPRTDR